MLLQHGGLDFLELALFVKPKGSSKLPMALSTDEGGGLRARKLPVQHWQSDISPYFAPVRKTMPQTYLCPSINPSQAFRKFASPIDGRSLCLSWRSMGRLILRNCMLGTSHQACGQEGVSSKGCDCEDLATFSICGPLSPYFPGEARIHCSALFSYFGPGA